MDTSTPWHTGTPIEPVEYEVTLKTVHGERIDDLAVRTLELCEGLNQPYRLTMTLLTEDTELERELLLKAQCTLTMGRPGAERTVHGVVTRCEFVTQHQGQLHIAVCVEPAVALLRHTTGRRIFQDLSVPEIVERVVADTFGTYSRELSELLAQQYPPRDYCTQMGETDLAFLQRILAEEGISYVFSQGVEEEVLVLTDHNSAFAPVGADVLDGPHDPPTHVPILPEGSELAYLESAQYFAVGHHAHTHSSTARGWDWLGAQPEALAAEATSDEFGAMGHMALAPRRMAEDRLSHDAPVAGWAELEAKRQRASGRTAHGRGNVVHMTAGSTCEISEHIQGDHDGQWVILTVTHRADCPEVELEWDGRGRGYENLFSTQRLEVPVVPPSAARPNVYGPQTAVVVAPAGEEIETDALGRVRVRMHWDQRSVDAPTCWLRVAQAWAGQGFGALFLPRAGMEVVVSFLDGDPDRPMVTGCVYNAQNTPPLDLPAKRSCSTIRTETTPGGEGFNELRFEDAKGQQEVFLHAQRTLREAVGDLHLSNIGGERKEFVGKDKHTQVANDFGSLVGGSYDLEVSGSHAVRIGCALPQDLEVDSPPGPGRATLNVEGEREVWCEKRHFIEVGKAARSSIDATPGELELAADQKIVLRVGKSVFTMTEDHIVLSSPTIELESAASRQRMDGAVELVSEGNIGAYAGASGPKSGSAQLELRTDGALLRAADALFVESGGEAVVSAAGLASVSGESVRVTGRSSALLEADNVSVKAGTQAGIDGGAALKLTAKVRIDIN